MDFTHESGVLIKMYFTGCECRLTRKNPSNPPLFTFRRAHFSFLVFIWFSMRYICLTGVILYICSIILWCTLYFLHVRPCVYVHCTEYIYNSKKKNFVTSKLFEPLLNCTQVRGQINNKCDSVLLLRNEYIREMSALAIAFVTIVVLCYSCCCCC